MNNNNFWGEPDDVEPLPDWMNPETFRSGGQKFKSSETLVESIQKALNKPPVDLSYLNKPKT
jgi:hypothetical protein